TPEPPNRDRAPAQRTSGASWDDSSQSRWEVEEERSGSLPRYSLLPAVAVPLASSGRAVWTIWTALAVRLVRRIGPWGVGVARSVVGSCRTRCDTGTLARVAAGPPPGSM